MTSGYTRECWLSVPDDRFADYYLISSEGRLQALDRIIVEANGKERFHKGRLVTPKQTGIYLGVSLFAKPHAQRFYLHRLVASAFVPNPDNKPHVNHINYNRYDNRAANLEWVTPRENTRHSAQAGRLGCINPVVGESHHSARLSENAVKWLRLSWKPGDSVAELATHFGVTKRALYQVLRGRTWKHVEPAVALHWPSARDAGS